MRTGLTSFVVAAVIAAKSSADSQQADNGYYLPTSPHFATPAEISHEPAAAFYGAPTYIQAEPQYIEQGGYITTAADPRARYAVVEPATYATYEEAAPHATRYI